MYDSTRFEQNLLWKTAKVGFCTMEYPVFAFFATFALLVTRSIPNAAYAVFRLHVTCTFQNLAFAIFRLHIGAHIAESCFCSFCIACGFTLCNVTLLLLLFQNEQKMVLAMCYFRILCKIGGQQCIFSPQYHIREITQVLINLG